MEYKGKHIKDTIDIKRYEKVEKFTSEYSNKIELGIEDLDELKDLIRKKESELKEKGVRFSDVKIEMLGVNEYFNPNGPDEPAKFITELTWMDEETEEEREKRIKWVKNHIDKVIEDQIARQDESDVRHLLQQLRQSRRMVE